MKAGFIGYRGFANKLKVLFKSSIPDIQILYYHPNKKIPDCSYTNNLNDLFSCDFIVITSPDRTHYHYIKDLKIYSGYIFCEKIPATEFDHLSYLESLKNDKLYFNFNYRRSVLYEILERYKEDLLYMNYTYGMGLALKENYNLNWRSKAESTPLGVLQVSGIHQLDLVIYTFGLPLSYYFHSSNITPYGDSIDNFAISMIFNTKNKCKVDLYFSYTAPYNYKIHLMSTNNLIDINRQEINIRGPREYYTKEGLFATPPIIENQKIDIYKDSLAKSVNYFVETMQNNGKFVDTSTPRNYDGNRFFLKLQQEIKEGVHEKIRK